MAIRKIQRSKLKIRITLEGLPGTGKSFGALRLAKGLCQDESKICIIDSENRIDLYGHMGNFMVNDFDIPEHVSDNHFCPDRFTQKIHECCRAGAQVIIIDSLSFAWEGLGSALHQVSALTTNSTAKNATELAWQKVTPKWNRLLHAIDSCPAHTICILRVKDIVETVNGKRTKTGLAPVIRSGFEYTQMVYAYVNSDHRAICSKDNTGLLGNVNPFELTETLGRQFRDWCEEGVDSKTQQIFEDCVSIVSQIRLIKSNDVNGLEAFENWLKNKDMNETTLNSLNHMLSRMNESTKPQPEEDDEPAL